MAVYAATLGIPAQPGLDYAGNEPHHLLAAESILSDRDVDLRRRVRRALLRLLVPAGAQDRRPRGRRAARRAARRRLRAADRARLRHRRRARRAVGDARAAGASRSCSAPRWRGGWSRSRGRRSASAWSASPHPRWPPRRRSRRACPAAVLLAGAAWCALAIREHPRRRYVAVGRAAAGRAALARLDVPGRRARSSRGRSSSGRCASGAASRRFVAGEALAASLVFYATINDRFYGGITPRSAGSTSLPELPAGLRRADPAARRAVAGPRRRAAALGAAAGARVLRGLAAVPLAARPARARRSGPARGGGVRGAAARGRGRAAARRGAAGGRRAARADVPGRADGGVLPCVGALVRVGAAARAAAGRGAAGAGDAGRERVAADRWSGAGR